MPQVQARARGRKPAATFCASSPRQPPSPHAQPTTQQRRSSHCRSWRMQRRQQPLRGSGHSRMSSRTPSGGRRRRRSPKTVLAWQHCQEVGRLLPRRQVSSPSLARMSARSRRRTQACMHAHASMCAHMYRAGAHTHPIAHPICQRALCIAHLSVCTVHKGWGESEVVTVGTRFPP